MTDRYDEKLKPCPFCGSTDIRTAKNNGNRFMYFCALCEAEGPTAESWDLADDAWQERVFSIEPQITAWANARGLISGTTAEKQFIKLIEEVGELSQALIKQDLDAAKDAIGDCAVVLVNLSAKLGTTLTECIQLAYDEIKDRKGQMVNGAYIKNE